MHQPLRRQPTFHRGSSSTADYQRSDDSQDSQSTAPTSINDSPNSTYDTYNSTPERFTSRPEYRTSPSMTYFARSSVETYASGASEEEELFLEPESYESDPDFDVKECREVVDTDLRPTNPGDFAEYFPSTNRLFIRHDDTTYDGNMNLRVDTEGISSKETIQLFHLRMQDLKKREFSLRRYERSSGREVCHSSRKYVKSAADQRPALTRSVSNAFASIRKPDVKRTNSIMSNKSQKSTAGVIRQDSGYGGSFHEDDTEIADFMSELKLKSPSIPTNTTKLEFSNYAQIEVKRRGSKNNKRYEFHYWGFKYTWKRVAEKYSGGKSVAYHLHKGEGPAIAHIVPELRSPAQIQRENASGGWVPPCSMWISDESVVEALGDVPDVIIATGLITLVDDCIKQRFNSKAKHTHTHSVGVPLTPLKYDMEFVSPKAMVEHMFKRTNSSGSSKGESPLRYQNSPTPVRF
ncbi:hypothetical protein HYFRA_00004733 [Hymenoscyphus fraxineus]|uniref:Uncharacterized protein n=1 Tax=Hymenoscyphus fraxineus TaxID=746836 RepID=A0A9N9KYB0_9HELO|nr:hypothetical protein HYFRA_00004733 [Hymenoscyphus fraxineus]